MKNIFWKIYNFINSLIDKQKFFGCVWFFWSICSIISLYLVLFPITNKIDSIQNNLNQQQAESTILSYFSFIEEWYYEDAYNLFSDSKKSQHTLTWYISWAKDFITFEWLKISSLPDKDSVMTKIFLVEYKSKKRGMKSVPETRIFFVIYNSNKNKWEINYNNVLNDENWWRNWACDYYKFNHCE